MNIAEVMTNDLAKLDASSTAAEAARLMKENNIGDVVVCEDDRIAGIVTDRDIVLRVVAENKNPLDVKLSEIASQPVTTLTPDDSFDDAVRLMAEHAVRRLPVVDNGRPVGIVSLGDLAVERDPKSALAGISAAPPQN